MAPHYGANRHVMVLLLLYTCSDATSDDERYGCRTCAACTAIDDGAAFWTSGFGVGMSVAVVVEAQDALLSSVRPEREDSLLCPCKTFRRVGKIFLTYLEERYGAPCPHALGARRQYNSCRTITRKQLQKFISSSRLICRRYRRRLMVPPTVPHCFSVTWCDSALSTLANRGVTA